MWLQNIEKSKLKFAPVAQRKEHLVSTQNVVGSNPIRRAILDQSLLFMKVHRGLVQYHNGILLGST